VVATIQILESGDKKSDGIKIEKKKYSESSELTSTKKYERYIEVFELL